jgi:L-threonylcarbamoyladenylate synthase
MFPPWTTPEAAAEILKNGGVVAIPTETVYGLAGNAYDPKALAKIFEAKKRPHFDPLIVHISAIEELSNVALEVPEVAKKLAKAYWPGPMTLVLPKKDCIPDLATSGLPTVAVRFPNHPIAQKIIRLAGVPLAAPSANLFQHVSPTTAQHVAEQLGNVIDGIVDGGSCGVGVESTIISFPEGKPVILRPGGITPEMVEAVAGSVTIHESKSNPKGPMLAPGMIDRHYRPQVPLFYGAVPKNAKIPPETVRIAFGSQESVIPPTVNLSTSGDLKEATANLYAFMRQMDKPGVKLILVDPIPNEGLGVACNDRLKRAAVRQLPESF